MIWCRPLLPSIAVKPCNRRRKRLLRPAKVSGVAVPVPQDQATDDEHAGLLCSVCHARITSEDLAMAMNGRHQHAFFNPAGIAFEVRCFQAAPGAVALDAPSTEFSWFAGYAWQVALCVTCRTHLGWRFVGCAGEPAFHGLIASRLLAP